VLEGSDAEEGFKRETGVADRKKSEKWNIKSDEYKQR
jgi:hypothetical protein